MARAVTETQPTAVDHERFYQLLVGLATQLASAVREQRSGYWLYLDQFTELAHQAGLREGQRAIWPRLLQPLQRACLHAGLPDLSALVVSNQVRRADSGQLINPLPDWWQAYEGKSSDIGFWFQQYRQARDYAWPAAYPF